MKRPAGVYFFHAAREFGKVLRSAHCEPHHKCSLHVLDQLTAGSAAFRGESVELPWSLRGRGCGGYNREIRSELDEGIRIIPA
jgi:hypothetical protein